MSIDNDLQPVASITEGDRALDLFTDRYSFTRLLAERLNDSPRREILFFSWSGGEWEVAAAEIFAKAWL